MMKRTSLDCARWMILASCVGWLHTGWSNDDLAVANLSLTRCHAIFNLPSLDRANLPNNHANATEANLWRTIGTYDERHLVVRGSTLSTCGLTREEAQKNLHYAYLDMSAPRPAPKILSSQALIRVQEQLDHWVEKHRFDSTARKSLFALAQSRLMSAKSYDKIQHRLSVEEKFLALALNPDFHVSPSAWFFYDETIRTDFSQQCTTRFHFLKEGLFAHFDNEQRCVMKILQGYLSLMPPNTLCFYHDIMNRHRQMMHYFYNILNPERPFWYARYLSFHPCQNLTEAQDKKESAEHQSDLSLRVFSMIALTTLGLSSQNLDMLDILVTLLRPQHNGLITDGLYKILFFGV